MKYIVKYTGTLNAYRTEANSLTEAKDKVLLSTGVINPELARGYLKQVRSNLSELRIRDIISSNEQAANR